MTLLTLTPGPTVLLLPVTVSHHGRLISLPVALSTTQNTISNPAGVRLAWRISKKRKKRKKDSLNNGMIYGEKNRKNWPQSLSDQELTDRKRRPRKTFTQSPDQLRQHLSMPEFKENSKWAEQFVFSPCLAERTPVRGLLFDFPYVLEYFLLSRAVCGEGEDKRIKRALSRLMNTLNQSLLLYF